MADPEAMSEENEMTTYEAIQRGVGGCREWVGNDRCSQPSVFVLWGKLLPPEALGPRCYHHAAAHLGHRALNDPSYAIVDLRWLAKKIDDEADER